MRQRRVGASGNCSQTITFDFLRHSTVRQNGLWLADQLSQMACETIQKENLFCFKNFGSLLLVKAEDIAYIQGDRNYSKMFLANGECEDIFERLGKIEQILPTNIFERAGKSVIINKKYVRSINSRKSPLQIVTPSASYEVPISANVLKTMKSF